MKSNNFYQQIFNNSSFLQESPKYLASCKEKAQILRKKIIAKELAMLEIVNNVDGLVEIQKLADKISKFKKVLLLGVGGSSLGGKTLTAITDESYQDKIEFLESIDPKTVQSKLSKIDFANSFFLVISKSGATIETICQTLIVIDEVRKNPNHPTIFANNFLFVTESRNTKLAQIAKEIGAPIANHPNNIGGRFSYLSIVGLLPAAICGLSLHKIQAGAISTLKNFLENEENEVIESCVHQLSLADAGFQSHVIMPYIDDLKDFTDWYRQLFAESLGKNSFGITPINSMGTIDQHSQLQLYISGPKDKFFTFITRGKNKEDFLISDLNGVKTLFGGKNLSEIVRIEQETTIESLDKKDLPIRTLIIDELNEESLSALMMQMFLETILISYVKEIDPFDQPAVEERKEMAKLKLTK